MATKQETKKKWIKQPWTAKVQIVPTGGNNYLIIVPKFGMLVGRKAKVVI